MLRTGLTAIVLLLLSLSPEATANVIKNAFNTQTATMGVELNPVSFLFSDDNFVHMSGGFVMFQPDTSTEINFPFEYKNIKDEDEQYTVVNLGFQIRRALQANEIGYYASLNARLTNINEVTTKLGLGFGLGYRKIFKSGLFWGYGITLGRYIGENDKYHFDNISDAVTHENSSYMLDIDFLKVGLLF